MSHTNGSQPKLRQHVFPSCACCIRHTVFLQLSTPLPATQTHSLSATQHTPSCNSVHPLLQLSTPLPATQYTPSCNSAHPFLQLRHTPSCGAGSAQLVRRGDQDQGSADGQQRSDPLGTHLCQGEALPQLAGRCARLGRQPEPLLGNPPARLGLQRHGGDRGGWLCCRT